MPLPLAAVPEETVEPSLRDIRGYRGQRKQAFYVLQKFYGENAKP